MSRRITWENKALDDFDDILDFLAERSPQGAEALERKLTATLEILASHPIGRPSRISVLFEKPVVGTSYTIAYGLKDDAIIVVRVVHQRRDWPKDGWPQD